MFSVSRWCSRLLELAVPLLCAVLGAGTLAFALRMTTRLTHLTLPPDIGILMALLLTGMLVGALLTLGAGCLSARVLLFEYRIEKCVHAARYRAAAHCARAAVRPRWFPALQERFERRAQELDALAEARARARPRGERVPDDA